MNMINAAKFKEQCLALIDQVKPEGLVITKHGRPVAKLIPIEQSDAHLIGALKGRLHYSGDIYSTEEKWNAES